MRQYILLLCAAVMLVVGLATKVGATTSALPVVLSLESIEQLKSNSSTEDDLYFVITEYSNQKRPSQDFVPSKPNHWLPNQLPKVKKVDLWKRSLASGEAVELVISLADQGIEPFSADDDLGTLKLFIVNAQKDPTVKFLWGVPEQNAIVKEQEINRQATFLLKASKGIYRITLSVQNPATS